MTDKFTFVAVVYNNYDDTYDFCRSLKDLVSDGARLVCILVDNSDNADIKRQIDSLAAEFSFVSTLKPDRNLGYFGAFNHFFASEFFDRETTVVLCNNDLMFQGDFCRQFVSSKYSAETFVVCPDVITVDGEHQNPHVLKPLGRLSRLKLDLYFSHYYVACALRFIQRRVLSLLGFRKRNVPASPGYVHMGIGACYVLLPSFFEQFCRLEFPHFLYGEEAYLSRQVHSGGGKLYYDPALKVAHKESATLSKLPSRTTYEFGREGYREYRKFY